MSDIIKDFENYLRYELYRSPHTADAYLRDLNAFINFRCADTEAFNPKTITAHDIRHWIAVLSQKGDSPRTLRRKTQSLRAFFRYLCRRHGYADNPADEIILAKIPKHLPDFIKDADMIRLIYTAQENETSENSPQFDTQKYTDPLAQRNHLLLHILYATGMRRAEVISLTDNSISFSNNTIRVVGKGNKERVIPIAPLLSKEIQEWIPVRDELFPDLDSPRPIIATRFGKMSPANIEIIINRLLNDETVAQKSPHTLRHSFATSMLNSGADLNSVRAILGHTSLSTTQIYTHLQFSDLRNIYSKAHPRAGKDPDKKME